jgi:hypothetical protein
MEPRGVWFLAQAQRDLNVTGLLTRALIAGLVPQDQRAPARTRVARDGAKRGFQGGVALDDTHGLVLEGQGFGLPRRSLDVGEYDARGVFELEGKADKPGAGGVAGHEMKARSDRQSQTDLDGASGEVDVLGLDADGDGLGVSGGSWGRHGGRRCVAG